MSKFKEGDVCEIVKMFSDRAEHRKLLGRQCTILRKPDAKDIFEFKRIKGDVYWVIEIHGEVPPDGMGFACAEHCLEKIKPKREETGTWDEVPFFNPPKEVSNAL